MRAKVLCIAIDAGDKDLILEWANAGVLPAFRALLERGAWGVSNNPRGLYVGAVWPSFMTGASPAHHGRYCYEQFQPGTYEIRRVHASSFAYEPFWSELSRAGRRVAVIDVPKSDVRPDLNGIQLCNWGTHDRDREEQFATWPVALAGEVRDRFGDDPIVSCDHCAARAGLGALREALLRRIQVKTALSEHFLDQGGWDLFLTVYSESHCAGHQFWHLHDPGHVRHGERAGWPADPLREVYAAIDAGIARLLQRADAHTSVIVLASHGMGPHYSPTFLLDAVLRRFEQLPPPRPSTADALRAATVRAWQRTPAAARRLLQPVRDHLVRQMQRRPRRLDRRRKCLPIPNNEVCGGIRINLVGREPAGRVQPGREYDQLCTDLEHCLLALTNPATGKPAVRHVLRSADIYPRPRLDNLPDLLVEWCDDAPTSRLASPTLGHIDGVPRRTRTGDHRCDGLWIACGPSVRPGHHSAPVSVIDFAPTIAALLEARLTQVEGTAIAAVTG